MRPIIIVLVVVAMTIAGLTAMLVSRFVAEQQTQVQAVPVPTGPSTESVLVVAADIKAGSLLKSEDMRYENWPSSAIDARFVRRGTGDDPKAGFIGTVAKRALMAGEPMSPQVVFRQDESGVVAGMLSPGMRAISVAVAPTGSVSGFILPNDRVDILLTADLRTMASSSDPGQASDSSRFSSEVVLSDVRVLAVDDKLAKGDASSNIAGRAYTVEVTPKDAEILSIAQKMGDLSLVLRSLSPGLAGDLPPTGFTAGTEASRALQASMGLSGGGKPAAFPKSSNHSSGVSDVRVNRGGLTSSQSFSN